MPDGYIINDALPVGAFERVSDRVQSLGFSLQEWPNTPLADVAAPTDVAIFVVIANAQSASEVQRAEEAVAAQVRIITIFLDEQQSEPGLSEDYGSGTAHLDADDLEEILTGVKITRRTATGDPAKPIKINPNKC